MNKENVQYKISKKINSYPSFNKNSLHPLIAGVGILWHCFYSEKDNLKDLLYWSATTPQDIK